ncbi:MAG: AI-2E family transporter [Oscillospiraceae bacterium]|nr:AI-2E family transporter [Oscillospiraceae bacterium]
MHKLFLLVAGSLVFAWLLLDTARATLVFKTVWNLISPFVVGAAIAFVFNVPMRAIERQLDGIHKTGLRRGLAIILTIAALVLVIMFVVELLVPQVILTVESLAEKIPAFAERTANNLMALMDENPEVKEWILDFFNLESIDWASLVKNTLTFVGDKASSVMGGAVNVIGNVTNGIVNTVIGIVFAIYCLGRKEILARQGRRILYSILPEKTTDEIIRILRLTNVTFSNFISGQCLEACILGCLFAVAMAIFKMPYIPLVSVTIAVTALIPVVGAFVGCIVGAFFILVNDPLQAVTFVVMFLVIQQLENNLIYPRVVGTSIGLPGMWVLVAVSIGGEIMGVGGMLVMIPLTSVLYTLAREFTDKRLEARGIPEEKLWEQPPEIKSQFQQNKERKERRKLQQQMKEKIQKLQEQQKKK